MRHKLQIMFALTGVMLGLTGCGLKPQGAIPPPQPVLMQHAYSAPVANIFDWRNVPMNQRIPVERALFDQEGYQIITPDGAIVVPFANQNLYVLKFARSFSGATYFVNQGDAPVLYLANGFGLTNAAAQGAMWYPLPNSYQPVSPIYVGLAPSWAAYRSMGWYPGMTYYGGLYSPFYRPGMVFHAWTPGYVINIGGRPFTNYRSYSSYYRATPGYARVASGGAVYTQPRAARYVSHSSGSNNGSGYNGSAGNFGGRRGTFGGPNNAGSMGARPGRSFGGVPAYQSSPRSGGSFGASGRSSGGVSSSGRSVGSGSSFGRSGGFGGSSSSGRSSSGSSSSGRRR